MHAHRRRLLAAAPRVRAGTVVLFLTGGLVGVMAYAGSVAPFVWVVGTLLGVWLHGRLPRSDARWRGVGTAVSLLAAGGVLATIAYHGAFDATPAFVGACLTALVLAPERSV